MYGFPHARPGQKIGLLGGSFDPPHAGHVHITLEALKRFRLDKVWWLVSPGNPLKREGPAPLHRRMEEAGRVMHHPRVVVTDIEARLGTRYTVDTLAALVRRYPRHRFIWLMGADNLGQFHRWRDWRRIARTVPIAVIARPGYDAAALAAPATGWLRRFQRPARQAKNWTEWSVPALVLLRFRPDPTSATQLRAADPAWHRRYALPISAAKPFTQE